ncbi:hypothetical protein U2G91_15690 [Rhodococcoides fascians]|nr:hypothetical protein [Rhodococcus fascians]WQH26545.1 hypothetical protein U2G91_15690 [Rhodococcus fascians]
MTDEALIEEKIARGEDLTQAEVLGAAAGKRYVEAFREAANG